MPSQRATKPKISTKILDAPVPANTRSKISTANISQTPDRRRQILDAAAKLFAEFGFETTSVRMIANAVNILAGSLYHHFATKEDMLHEILRDPLARIEQDNIGISQLPVDAEQRLITSIIVRFQRAMTDWEVNVLLQNDGNFFRRRKDFLYVQEGKSRAFKMQEKLFQEGMASGLFRGDLDVYLMIGTISRMLSAAAGWYRAGDLYSAERPAGYTLDRVIAFHVDCILRMVRNPARLDQPIPLEACKKLAAPA